VRLRLRNVVPERSLETGRPRACLRRGSQARGSTQRGGAVKRETSPTKNVRRLWGSMRRSLRAVSLSTKGGARAARPTFATVPPDWDRTAYCLFTPYSPRWWWRQLSAATCPTSTFISGLIPTTSCRVRRAANAKASGFRQAARSCVSGVATSLALPKRMQRRPACPGLRTESGPSGRRRRGSAL